MRSAVLDSYALLAFLFGEPGSELVLAVLEGALEKNLRIMIAAPNWAEVRYMVARKSGEARWAPVRERLLGLPLEIVAADQQLAERAGEIKSRHAMSLADCFAAALAKLHRAELYTGDPEFHAVEKDIRIVWLPQATPPA